MVWRDTKSSKEKGRKARGKRNTVVRIPVKVRRNVSPVELAYHAREAHAAICITVL